MDILNYLCALYNETQASTCDPNPSFEIKRELIENEKYLNDCSLTKKANFYCYAKTLIVMVSA